MRTVHDATHRASLEARIRSLRPDAARRWGKMTLDQMLWHVNVGLSVALGETTIPTQRPPLPRPLMKFLVLNMPWMKGAPTSPIFVTTSRYDVEAERARCLQLLGRLANQPLDGPPIMHPIFGTMSGTDVSRLHAKHLDHHLRQFNA